jgi:L-lactate dehydrogenase
LRADWDRELLEQIAPPSQKFPNELKRNRFKHNPRGILLIGSNPVDVMTYSAWKWSGLPANHVIGSGTSLDTARFRRRLAEKYGVAPGNVHAYVVGEHGDGQFPVLSSARIAGAPLEEFCRQMGLPYDPDALGMIARETRLAGAKIIRAKRGDLLRDQRGARSPRARYPAR